MKMYEVQLANPVVQQDLEEMSKISTQIEETQTELDSLYEKWERLCEQLFNVYIIKELKSFSFN